MTSPFLAIGFGLVEISMLFLVIVFFRAWRDPDLLLDRRYRLVSFALTVGTIGIALWAFNPLSQALDGPPLTGVAMFISSALLLVSATTLIASTVLNGSKITVSAFVVVSIIWTFACLLVGFVL